ncbi:MAG: hypothetical protein ACREJM_14390, partial [Candidatus Saccharimonadales bacterium]
MATKDPTMTLTLEIPSELESELAAEAAQFGISLPEYALRLLSSGRTPASQPRNGAELVAYWQAAALVGIRSDIVDAPARARA